ncbi:MAG: YheT family hydrolase [Brachymonas sp.]
MAGQILTSDYSAPWWLPDGHSQTIAPALWGRTFYAEKTVAQHYQRQRWAAPDGDFVDVDFGAHAWQPERGLLLLFHGLEGSSQSQYARALLRWCELQGMGFAVAHARGCSGEVNHAPRAYHSGDWEEIDWIVQRLHTQLQAEHGGEHGQAVPLYAVGVSLGGNALLRWAEESGEAACRRLRAIAAICSPIDLAAGAQLMDASWWQRNIYTRNFLQTMIPRALERLALHPGLFDGEAMRRVRTFFAFDDLFTAPLHGFKGAADYWAQCSAKPHLQALRLPTLLVQTHNDPIVPAYTMPTVAEVSSSTTLWQPRTGGHVGFPGSGRWPCSCDVLPAVVGSWLKTH